MVKKTVTAIFIVLLMLSGKPLYGSEAAHEYQVYKKRMEDVAGRKHIEEKGFTIIDEQIFDEMFESLGLLTVIPALDEKNGRLILFFADENGQIVYKTDDFETNNWNKGELEQPNRGLYAIAFWDVNNDERKDIILVHQCKNEPLYDQYFKAGDVLFQGESGFYRDRRISDTINSFSMCASVEMITAFVRDGISAEFLYLAETKADLIEKGFQPLKGSYFSTYFERFGNAEVLTGTFAMANHHIFMVYLIDDSGRVLWNFQPMADADTFIALMDITFQDINGDGLKDLAFMAGYRCMDGLGEMSRVNRYEIYYQRAGYFTKDEAFSASGLTAETDTLRDIVTKAKVFWEW